MAGSSAERELRDAVVTRLRAAMPNARIVHELNVAGQGTNRIDVAAIDKQAIVGVEIKSAKDKLTRLEDQWRSFTKVCHHVIVAAHEKHFKEFRDTYWRADVPSELELNHPLFFNAWRYRDQVWRYPMSDRGRYNGAPWPLDAFKDCLSQPRATDLLGVLWADELRNECAIHNISHSSKSTRPNMIRDMVWMMTGREIAQAVCRQLRMRPFAEADAPIYEAKAAA